MYIEHVLHTGHMLGMGLTVAAPPPLHAQRGALGVPHRLPWGVHACELHEEERYQPAQLRCLSPRDVPEGKLVFFEEWLCQQNSLRQGARLLMCKCRHGHDRHGIWWFSLQPAVRPSRNWCSTTPTPTRWFR